ncbi:hypothetical protein KWI83_18225 [Streptomyces sp. TRM70350]|nr:hypothetical protein [Streptomyces sp. TRM70350]
MIRGLGITTVLALHDLALALRYCDRLCVLADGTVVAAGPPREVLRPDLMADVFGARARQVEIAAGEYVLWCEPLPDARLPGDLESQDATESPNTSGPLTAPEPSATSEEEPAC